MVRSITLFTAGLAAAGFAQAQCPFADSSRRAEDGAQDGSQDTVTSRGHMKQYEVDDSEGYLTSDVGGPIGDQATLRAGARGPSLLEDFIFQQKITRFDHERVPERAVHARGAGAYGTFTSYGDYSNITAASFLKSEGKKTPVFVRFSTVAGSRGSADTARDVHGFAVRLYTDEGNFDLVGNNIPVFFVQDAIHFPDLLHAVKPRPDSEMPQAATNHDNAWDFFSQQTSTLHTLFWAMSGHGIPRSYRHMDGFPVHTYRLVNDDGEDILVRWHFKTKQGKAALVWDEAQHVAGKNADFHRQDLFEAIEAGNYPEWELSIQIIDQAALDGFAFDYLDPTKIVPEELAPLQPIGVLRLDANPVNYFAETEQAMFQPGHIVRGVDFSNDPLLQGRIFSYIDTQLNRHGGANFEQIPVNRPIAKVTNNNRDGVGQAMIHKNTAAYSPNTMNGGFPMQANQTVGKGFFTAPRRSVSGNLVREQSPTFADHWSQPRLFYNSLSKVEQQFLINSLRFEIGNVRRSVQENALRQLNRISNDIAARVGQALGLAAPEPDPTYYHDNKTQGISIVEAKLPTIAGLRIGVLASTGSKVSLEQASAIRAAFAGDRVAVTTVAEALVDGVNMTYSGAEAVGFDGVIVAAGAEGVLSPTQRSTLFPPGRPAQILADSFHWGKPLGFLGSSATAARAAAGMASSNGTGIYVTNDTNSMVTSFREGLATFKFVDRFPLDQ